VLLELDFSARWHVAEQVRDIRARSPAATLIGMTCDASQACRAPAIACGVDHCVPVTPVGHTRLVTIVNAMQPERGMMAG
jgi:hypothetical protein